MFNSENPVLIFAKYSNEVIKSKLTVIARPSIPSIKLIAFKCSNYKYGKLSKYSANFK